MPCTMLRAALVAATLSLLGSCGLRPLMAQGPMLAEEDVPDHLTAPQAAHNPDAVQPAAGAPAACPGSGAATAQGAGGGPRPGGPPMPLFYNYYVGPPGVPAQLYPGPRPTPAFVGQVWITYPPFMPHEYLYHHHRRYYRYTPSGYNSASVRYSSGIMGFIPAF
jgi:hypothetical protein